MPAIGIDPRSLIVASAALLAFGCAALPTPPDLQSAYDASKAGEQIDLNACVVATGHGGPSGSFFSDDGPGPKDYGEWLVDYYQRSGLPPFRSLRATSSVKAAGEEGCDLALKVSAISGSGGHVQAESFSAREGEHLATRRASWKSGRYFEIEKQGLKSSYSGTLTQQGHLYLMTRIVGPIYADFKKGSPLYERLVAERKAAKKRKAAAAAEAESEDEPADAAPAAPARTPKPAPKPLNDEQKGAVDSQL